MPVILSPNPQVGNWIKPVDEKTMKLMDFDVGEISDYLVLETILERYPLEELPKVVSYYGSKIQKGAFLKVIGPDLMKFCIEFSHYRLKHEDFRVFGGFQCALSVDKILDSIPQGFKLISWEHINFNYMVTLERL